MVCDLRDQTSSRCAGTMQAACGLTAVKPQAAWRSPLAFDSEVQSLRPEVVLTELYGGTWRVQRGNLSLQCRWNKVGNPRNIDDAIDLRTGPDHVVPIQEVVSEECPEPRRDLIADVQIHFGDNGKAVALE